MLVTIRLHLIERYVAKVEEDVSQVYAAWEFWALVSFKNIQDEPTVLVVFAVQHDGGVGQIAARFAACLNQDRLEENRVVANCKCPAVVGQRSGCVTS